MMVAEVLNYILLGATALVGASVGTAAVLNYILLGATALVGASVGTAAVLLAFGVAKGKRRGKKRR